MIANVTIKLYHEDIIKSKHEQIVTNPGHTNFEARFKKKLSRGRCTWCGSLTQMNLGGTHTYESQM